jgi:hypothetical protein
MNLKTNKKMKLKTYSIAAIVLTGLMACCTANYAQQASTAPSATSTIMGQGYAQAGTPAVNYSRGQVYYTSTGDTSYDRKMRKLQEQMTALRKQMEEVRSEGRTKSNEIIQTKMAENTKRLSERFNRTFKNFGTGFRFNMDNDSAMKKRVESGEVKQKTKSYSKSYPVDGNDELKIDNRYGKVTINTWAKNEVKVDVQINAYALNDADAQKWLDQTSIADSKAGNVVSFKTVLDNTNENWGTSSTNGKITYMHKEVINYTVYMPAKSALTIDNRYGAIELPSLDGKITINNSYGGLLAKSLTNSGNTINVRYGNASIGTLTGGNLEMGYSNLKIDNADKLNVDLKYSAAKIGKLNGSGVINVHYGDGLEIADIDKNLKSLSVNSSYSSVRLNTTSTTNADFDVTLHNANFDYDNNAVSVTSKTPEDGSRGWSSTKTYKGHVGKGSADKVITVTSHYGNVKFN